MKGSKSVIWSAVAAALVLALLCFGPWYESIPVTVAVSLIKLVGLFAVFFASMGIVKAGSAADPNRSNWLILGFSFLSYAIGQTVLSYYSVILRAGTPFPSLADPFFVLYAPLVIYALFSFCKRAAGSGLSLGSPLAFWWPAFAVLGISAIGLPLILMPVIETGGTWQELFLNIYYPLISFVALAPCAVILRFGIKFRGGNLFWVWLIFTAGFLSILLADLMFAYFSALHMETVSGLVDFLYSFGYVLIPLAAMYQGRLQRS